ncbi:MAG: hypothetical protein C6Y22_13145 [Hapalosiphonaceae cyanobacterium JJU2]|nr:MAG: hypothetical protein C6Y22_13145 [Hapalosiphonaceae cyanobacterium JJU2]
MKGYIKGDKGDKGDMGDMGDKGDTGDRRILRVSCVFFPLCITVSACLPLTLSSLLQPNTS